jgi:hypothetical protein
MLLLLLLQRQRLAPLHRHTRSMLLLLLLLQRLAPLHRHTRSMRVGA